MNTRSHAERAYPSLTMPTRSLTGIEKPLRYVNAASTDIRATLEKFRRLERMKGGAK